jgi:hypothetical protein
MLIAVDTTGFDSAATKVEYGNKIRNVSRHPTNILGPPKSDKGVWSSFIGSPLDTDSGSKVYTFVANPFSPHHLSSAKENDEASFGRK